jgi:ATPase subunit of ABC transporter with duplicated ATPase domains
VCIYPEPTNHFDLTSWEVLVDAIREFCGTVLPISHDREFIDQTIAKIWVIENKKSDNFSETCRDI